MKFDWDADKRRKVIEKHGVDLFEAVLIFEADVLTRLDDRHDYGEERYVSIGLASGKCFVVVHTPRGDITWIITAWKGGRAERSQHQAHLARRGPSDEGPRRTLP